MSEQQSNNELDEEVLEMYQDMFRMMLDKCTHQNEVAVAGTMIGLAMRLYRTVLSDEDYNQMMDYITTNQDLIEPFSLMEFESPTVH